MRGGAGGGTFIVADIALERIVQRELPSGVRVTSAVTTRATRLGECGCTELRHARAPDLGRRAASRAWSRLT